MAIFKYRGITTAGKNVKATIQADDSTELKKILRTQGIILSDYEQLSEKRRSNFFAAQTCQGGQLWHCLRYFGVLTGR